MVYQMPWLGDFVRPYDKMFYHLVKRGQREVSKSRSHLTSVEILIVKIRGPSQYKDVVLPV